MIPDVEQPPHAGVCSQAYPPSSHFRLGFTFVYAVFRMFPGIPCTQTLWLLSSMRLEHADFHSLHSLTVS